VALSRSGTNRGRHIVLQRLQYLILECGLAVRVPFVLKGLIAMSPVTQAEPDTVSGSVQISRRADPHLTARGASHGVDAEKAFPFLELINGFLLFFLGEHHLATHLKGVSLDTPGCYRGAG
jgi:hypothetical protein